MNSILSHLSPTDAALFQRCYAMLQQTLVTGNAEMVMQAVEAGCEFELHTVPASIGANTPPSIATSATSATSADPGDASDASSPRRPPAASRKRKRISVNTSAPVATGLPTAFATAEGAPLPAPTTMFVPETPKRTLHTQLLLRLLTHGQRAELHKRPRTEAGAGCSIRSSSGSDSSIRALAGNSDRISLDALPYTVAPPAAATATTASASSAGASLLCSPGNFGCNSMRSSAGACPPSFARP